MDTEERGPPAAVALLALLEREAGRVPFFTLVGLLERASGRAGLLGGDTPPQQEPVRFRHSPELSFSTSDVGQVRTLPQTEAGGARFEVTTHFLGLTGAASPLPSYLLEEVAQEQQEHSARREFLDLFHHRMPSLLYRGIAGYSPSSQTRSDASDPWSRRLLALAGFDAQEGQSLPLAPGELLRLSALLAVRARSARTLELALEELLGESLDGARVKVVPFVEGWVTLEPGQRNSLGRVNTQLGRSMLLGSRRRDRAGSFRVEIGPVDQPAYRRFLAGGDLAARLKAVVQAFTREPLEYQVGLTLRRQETPQMRLASSGGSQLGRDGWLGQPGEREVRVTVAQEAA